MSNCLHKLHWDTFTNNCLSPERIEIMTNTPQNVHFEMTSSEKAMKNKSNLSTGRTPTRNHSGSTRYITNTVPTNPQHHNSNNNTEWNFKARRSTVTAMESNRVSYVKTSTTTFIRRWLSPPRLTHMDSTRRMVQRGYRWVYRTVVNHRPFDNRTTLKILDAQTSPTRVIRQFQDAMIKATNNKSNQLHIILWIRHHFMLIRVGDHFLGAQGADRNCAQILWFCNFPRLTWGNPI